MPYDFPFRSINERRLLYFPLLPILVLRLSQSSRVWKNSTIAMCLFLFFVFFGKNQIKTRRISHFTTFLFGIFYWMWWMIKTHQLTPNVEWEIHRFRIKVNAFNDDDQIPFKLGLCFILFLRFYSSFSRLDTLSLIIGFVRHLVSNSHKFSQLHYWRSYEIFSILTPNEWNWCSIMQHAFIRWWNPVALTSYRCAMNTKHDSTCFEWNSLIWEELRGKKTESENEKNQHISYGIQLYIYRHLHGNRYGWLFINLSITQIDAYKTLLCVCVCAWDTL